MKQFFISTLILFSCIFNGCQDELQKFDKYGISFTISDKLELNEYTVKFGEGILIPGECSYDDGLVSSSNLEFSLYWIKIPELSRENNNDIINNLLEVFRYHPGITAEIVDSIKRETISDFDVNFANIKVTQDSLEIDGIVATWYCQTSGRQFGYTVLHKNPENEMKWFLRSLVCY